MKLGRTTSVPMGFPVFTVAFTPVGNSLLVGGGGGATKAGVKNTVVIKNPTMGLSKKIYIREN